MTSTSVNLDDSTQKRADKYHAILGFSSRSRLVNAAIEEYLEEHASEIEVPEKVEA